MLIRKLTPSNVNRKTDRSNRIPLNLIRRLIKHHPLVKIKINHRIQNSIPKQKDLIKQKLNINSNIPQRQR